MKSKRKLLIGIIAAIVVAVVGITVTLAVTGVLSGKQETIIRNEAELRAAVIEDSEKLIVLGDDITVDGNLEMTKLRGFDLNGFSLTVGGTFSIVTTDNGSMWFGHDGNGSSDGGTLSTGKLAINAPNAHIDWNGDIKLSSSELDSFTVNTSDSTFVLNGRIIGANNAPVAAPAITVNGGALKIAAPEAGITYNVHVDNGNTAIENATTASDVVIVTSKSVSVSGKVSVVSDAAGSSSDIVVTAAASSTVTVKGNVGEVKASGATVVVDPEATVGKVEAADVTNSGTVSEVTATGAVENKDGATIGEVKGSGSVVNEGTVSGAISSSGDVENKGEAGSIITEGNVVNEGAVSGNVTASGNVENKENASVGGDVTVGGDINNEGTIGGDIIVDNTVYIDKPTYTGVTEFTYNGEAQGITIDTNDGYTLGGAALKNTNAGEYSVTVTLNENYKWTGGGTEVLTFTYTIKKAKLEITPSYDTNAKVYVGGSLPEISTTESVSGTIVWDNYVLNEAATGKAFGWTWTPNDTTNYETVTGTVNFDVLAVVLDRIEITTNPSKTAYTAFEKFDTTGMAVTAYYNDGTSETKTTYTVTNGNNLQAGTTSVTVSYTEGGVTKEVTVAITVSKITLEITPSYDTNAKVYVGGSLPEISTTESVSGTIVWDNYVLNEAATGKAFGWTWTPSDTTNYETVTGTVNFDVLAVVLDRIEITTNPSKTAYTAFDNFNTEGMEVTAYYNDGTSETIATYTVTNGDNLQAGTTSVTVSYREGGVTKEVTVAITVSKITLEITPSYDTNAKVYVGGSLPAISTTESVSGTIAWNNYELNEAATSKAFDWTWTPSDTANYETVTGTVNFDVLAVVLDRIEITTNPSKTAYTAFDNFNTEGMEVTAYYNDGTSETIATYTVTNGDNLQAGTTSVTVSYREGGVTKEVTVAITVSKITVAKPTLVNDELNYTGKLLTVFTAPTDAQYTVSGNTATDIGSHTITFTLSDSANYKWSDSDEEYFTLTWSIIKASGYVKNADELKEALKDTNFDKIVLTADIETSEGISIERDVTIDFNGFTLTGDVTVTAGKLTVNDNANNGGITGLLTVDGETAEIEINGGKFTNSGNKQVLLMQNGANGVINGGAFKFNYLDGKITNMVQLASDGNTAATLTIGGGTFESGAYGFAVLYGSTLNYAGGKTTAQWTAISGNNLAPSAYINVSGGELIAVEDTVIYMPSAGKLNISGGSLTGKSIVDVRQGEVIIGANAVLNATATEWVSLTTKPGGTTVADGSAIIVNEALYSSQITDQASSIKVTIDPRATVTAKSGRLITVYNWNAISGQITDYNFGDKAVKYYEYVNGAIVNYAPVTTAEQLNAAIAEDFGTIKLGASFAADVVIPEGKTVTIDLNGFTLTGSIVNNGNLTLGGNGTVVSNVGHAITNKGTLTIESGTYDAVAHEKAALYNASGASATINGGEFIRSQEKGTPNSANGNSWYVVYNAGTIVMTGGKVSGESGLSSSFINVGSAESSAYATFSGNAYVSGGRIAVKNDIFGVMTIENGAKFEILADATNNAKGSEALLNVGDCTISGGTLVNNAAAGTGAQIIYNWGYNFNAEVTDEVKLTIGGGTFTATAADARMIYMVAANGSDTFAVPAAKISGGKFTRGGEEVAIEKLDLKVYGTATTDAVFAAMLGNVDVIKLGANITHTATLTVSKDVTIDFNGYTLTLGDSAAKRSFKVNVDIKFNAIDTSGKKGGIVLNTTETSAPVFFMGEVTLNGVNLTVNLTPITAKSSVNGAIYVNGVTNIINSEVTVTFVNSKSTSVYRMNAFRVYDNSDTKEATRLNIVSSTVNVETSGANGKSALNAVGFNIDDESVEFTLKKSHVNLTSSDNATYAFTGKVANTLEITDNTFKFTPGNKTAAVYYLDGTALAAYAESLIGNSTTEAAEGVNVGTVANKKVELTIGETLYYCSSLANAKTYAEKNNADNANGNATITMLADYEGTLSFSNLTCDITIDLDGNTIRSNSSPVTFNNTANNNYTVTFKNGTIESTGNYAVIVATEKTTYYGTLSFDNMTLKGLYGGLSTSGNGSGVTINATNSEFIGTAAISAGVYLAGNNTATFEGCKFSGSTGAYIKSGNNTFTDCAISSTSESYSAPEYNGSGFTATGSGLVIDSAVGYQGNIVVKMNGGAAEGCADGFGIEVVRTAATGVAQADRIDSVEISNVKSTYNIDDALSSKVSVSVNTAEQLESALIGNLKTIKLGASFAADVVIPEGKTVTIDLNGFILTNASDHTITNKGALTVTDSSAGKTGTVDNVTNAKAAIYNEVGGTVVIESGNFTRSKETGVDSGTSGGNSYYLILNRGEMTIDGGTFTQGGKYSSMIENGWQSARTDGKATEAKLTINDGTFDGGLNTVKNDDYGVLTIKDGTFKNVAQAVVLNWNVATVNGGDFTVNSETAYAVILNGRLNTAFNLGLLTVNGGTFTGADVFAQKSGSVDAGTIYVNSEAMLTAAIAVKNATVIYSAGGALTAYVYDEVSLKAALADEGITAIVLNGDIALTETVTVNRNVTLDFNEKTVTASLSENAFAFSIPSDSNAIVEFKNGTLVSDQRGIAVNSGNVTLTALVMNLEKRTLAVLDSATVTVGVGTDLTTTGADATIFIRGTAANGNTVTENLTPTLNVYGKVTNENVYGAIQGNGTDRSYTYINVYDGAEVTSSGTAIYAPQSGEINVYGGTVTGYSAIGIKSGVLNIEGGTVTGTGAFREITTNTNGINEDGSAIVIDSNSAYAGNVVITISGGKLVSNNSYGIHEIGKTTEETSVVSLDITGGEIDSKLDSVNVREVTKSNVKVSGGTFSVDVSDYVEAGKFCNYDAATNRYVISDVKNEFVAVSNETELRNALSAGGGHNHQIKLTGDVVLESSVSVSLNAATTLDLDGHTISGEIDGKRLFVLESGTFNVKNGTLDAIGSGKTAADRAGTVGAFGVNSGNLQLDGLTLKNYRPYGMNVKVYTGGSASLNNVNIVSSYGGGIEVAGGNVTVTGGTFTQTNVYDHNSSNIAVSHGGTVTINSGKFTSDNVSLYVFSSGGTIIVNNGTFTAPTALRADIDNAAYPEGKASLALRGGEFNGKTILHPSTNVEIGSANALRMLSEATNAMTTEYSGNITLTKDIDLGGGAFEPIAKKHGFSGTFDGAGHTVSNLTIAETDKNAGLFGQINRGGKVTNVTIENANVSGTESVGVIAGSSLGRVEKVNVNNAMLKGDHYLGGIVGYAYGNFVDCTVKELTATATPNNTAASGATAAYDNGDKVGGIVGYLGEDSGLEVSGCTVDGAALTGYRDIGGIVGTKAGGGDNYTFTFTNNTVKNVKITVDQVTNNYGDKEANGNLLVGRFGADSLKWFNHIYADAQNNTRGEGCAIDFVVCGGVALQSALDSAIANTTITLAAGTYSTAKFSGNEYDDRQEAFTIGHSVHATDYVESKAYRTVENLTVKAADGAEVIFTNNLAMTAGHVHAGAGPVYNPITGSAITVGSSYYSHIAVNGLTVKGMTFTDARVYFATSMQDDSKDVWTNITLENCKFGYSSVLATSDNDKQGARIYSETDKTKDGLTILNNVTVKDCSFDNVFQGVLTSHVNGLTFTNNTVANTVHNALGIQSNAAPRMARGAIVVSGNAFTNIGDRVIRFNGAENMTVSITDNAFVACGDAEDQLLKFSYATDTTFTASGNTYAATADATPVKLADIDSETVTDGYVWQYTFDFTLNADRESYTVAASSAANGLTSVEIPSSFNGKPVTAIGDKAFYNNKTLTSVKIPVGVTAIGTSAFYGCSALTSVEIPVGVTAIGNHAFQSCSKLASVTLNEGLETIGASAFYNCSALTSSVNVPVGVKTIGSSAFQSCKELESVTLGEGLETIGDSAFGYTALENVVIPDSVTTIDANAFVGITTLNNVKLGGGLITIGNGAFSNVGISSIVIPKSVNSIGKGAFNWCSKLTSVEFEDKADWTIRLFGSSETSTVDVSDASKNAKAMLDGSPLGNDYYLYVWERNYQMQRIVNACNAITGENAEDFTYTDFDDKSVTVKYTAIEFTDIELPLSDDDKQSLTDWMPLENNVVVTLRNGDSVYYVVAGDPYFTMFYTLELRLQPGTFLSIQEL